MAPSDQAEQAANLRLTNLPAHKFTNSVMVVRLEWDGHSAAGPASVGWQVQRGSALGRDDPALP
jgi:hypothetical protein